MSVKPGDDGDDLGLTDALAPPMANGEVVFEAPWQGRLFGMARVLAEQGHYQWDEFRVHLIREIADWDRADQTDDYHYYDHFLAAFQALLKDKGLLEEAAVDARAEAIGARPHGHDH